MCPQSTPLPEEPETSSPNGSVSTVGTPSEPTPLPKDQEEAAFNTCMLFLRTVLQRKLNDLPLLLRKKLVREAVGVICMRCAVHLGGSAATLSVDGNTVMASLECDHMTTLEAQGIT